MLQTFSIYISTKQAAHFTAMIMFTFMPLSVVHGIFIQGRTKTNR